MKARRAGAWASLPLVAVGLAACRMIVGITDLTVEDDAGHDAALDRMALPEAAPETGVPDALTETGTGTDAGKDASDAKADVGREMVDCAQPLADSDPGGSGFCVDACVSNHEKAVSDFYAAAEACICKTCQDECAAYCSLKCGSISQPMGACAQCATNAVASDGGACLGMANTTCKQGCEKLSMCIAGCLP
jgi:hypothetical protein